MKFEVQLTSPAGARTHSVELERVGDQWRIILNGEQFDADVAEIAPNTLSILIRGESHEIRVARSSDGLLKIQTGLREFTAEVADQRSWRGRRLGHVEVEGRQQITAPMAGKVVRLLVTAGEKVEIGQGLPVCRSNKNEKQISSNKIRNRRPPLGERR